MAGFDQQRLTERDRQSGHHGPSEGLADQSLLVSEGFPARESMGMGKKKGMSSLHAPLSVTAYAQFFFFLAWGFSASAACGSYL